MSKTKRKAKRREANLSEILDGPTEAQLANGHYVRDYVMQADNATQAMAKAVAFGARAVILGTGHRAVLRDGVIVTIMPKGGGARIQGGTTKEAAGG